MGKKIKKAFKKVHKFADPVKLIAGGDDDDKKAPREQPEVAPAPAPAQVVETPQQETQSAEEETESAKRAARARGKRGLSVARSSGSGLNI